MLDAEIGRRAALAAELRRLRKQLQEYQDEEAEAVAKGADESIELEEMEENLGRDGPVLITTPSNFAAMVQKLVGDFKPLLPSPSPPSLPQPPLIASPPPSGPSPCSPHPSNFFISHSSPVAYPRFLLSPGTRSMPSLLPPQKSSFMCSRPFSSALLLGFAGFLTRGFSPQESQCAILEEDLVRKSADIAEIQRLRILARDLQGHRELSWISRQRDAEAVVLEALRVAVTDRSLAMETRSEVLRLHSEVGWRNRILKGIAEVLEGSERMLGADRSRRASEAGSASAPLEVRCLFPPPPCPFGLCSVLRGESCGGPSCHGAGC